ncbi:carboxypeptidase-like regulatory domain-containing protein [Cognatitamlana onchidii]|uniref:carboxypeptidase-like regulatory domain-containing protein n=1 Tax=Cognatitamlana onchidii TaxID=2562860 RepID=UPI0010A69A3E|nr:carboxypeptidase-like regulatory domain-containing protein [Algibacter onchidii]
MNIKYCLLFFLLNSLWGYCQIIKGTVLEAKTKSPIESATIYFDNTTFGVITNAKGEFAIKYSDTIKSPLVISFLGYKKQIINNYREKDTVTVFLEENYELLNEVVVNANDGLTRKQKLKFFRREFLGSSRFGKSCTILNEDDLILRYNKKERVLTAHAKAPLHIENKALQYHVIYDLNSFTLKFALPSSRHRAFDGKSVSYLGNSYYENFEDFNEKKAIKNRNKAYAGSRLQFMRALYAQQFEDNKYQIFYRGVKVNPWKYFELKPEGDTTLKRVSLQKTVTILFDNWEISRIKFVTPSILVGQFGNYTKADKVHFSDAMGEKRVGEMLPFDYGL